MGVAGEINYLIKRVSSLIKHTESERPPAPTITARKAGEGPRDAGVQAPIQGQDTEPRELDRLALGHMACKGSFLPGLTVCLSSPQSSRGLSGR